MNTNKEKSVTADEANVSRIAYKLWENAGRPAGRDLEFWLTAEAQVRTASMPRAAAPVAEVAVKGNASKLPRPARGGLKKTWPKPYPSLPKF